MGTGAMIAGGAALGGMMGGGKGGGGGGGVGGVSAQPLTEEQIEKMKIDPTDAISAFKNAAAYLQPSISLANQQFRQQLAKAEGAGLQFSETARSAMNELESYLGLAPSNTLVDETGLKLEALRQSATTSGSSLGLSKLNSFSTAIKQRMQAADSAETTEERTRLRDETLGLVRDFKNRISVDMTNASNIFESGDPEEFQSEDMGTGLLGLAKNPFTEAGEADKARHIKTYRDASKELSNWFEGLTEIEGTLQQDFKVEKPQALTGEEVSQRIQESPEFTARFDVGQQALERQQAARGHLLSGRALTEAQQFGQNLAGDVYQGHLQRLSGLAGLNMPIVQQQSGLLANLGQQAYGASMAYPQQQAAGFRQESNLIYDAAQRNSDMMLQAALGNQRNAMQASMANQQAEMFEAQQGQQKQAGFGQLAGTVIGSFF